tara:strand:+ start:44152 stop:46665 length:2514 start_codon:yes stop_codon:yes gene_type:complete
MNEIKDLNREIVIQAISEIKDNPDKRYGRESTTYDLVYEGSNYPPILVLSESNKIAGGEALTLSDFNNNTDKAFSILNELGFSVINKAIEGSVQKQLIEKYKDLIQRDQNQPELYKWKLIKEFERNWDIEADDFASMIQSINFENLIDFRSKTFIKFSKEYSEDARSLFKLLFDEKISLEKRIKDFGKRSEEIVREYHPKKGAFQDERTIAAYLTFRYPNKYTFYKFTLYSDYTDLINVERQKTGKRYIHYLELIDEFIDDYISKDKELLKSSRDTLTADCFIDNNFNILAQDILYRTTQQGNNTNMKAEPFLDTLKQFLKQSKTDDLRYAHFDDEYNGLNVRVSFGKGNAARIPWISFLDDSQSTNNGIYPVYLLYKERNLLILAYGVSEENEPPINWDLDNPVTIADYFQENDLGKPERYGSSFVFKFYDLDKSIDYYSIDEDLYQLTNFYKKIISGREPGPIETPFNLGLLKSSLKNSSLIYDKNLTTRFAISLATKPFLILTGLSGSGKTKLAQAFAKWICEDKNQINLVSVGADWTNREPLFGYPNALEPKDYVLPESGVLQLILQAEDDPNKPYFLILDEMNLSHVERYFADFLSAIESKEEIKLHSGDEGDLWNGVQSTIKIPENLFIIGTVNIDETTYMFSPKVLDRANVIEFRVSQIELKQFLENPEDVDLELLRGQGASMAEDFVRITANKAGIFSKKEDLNKELLQFFKELNTMGAEFGYRTAYEINRFAAIFEQLAMDWEFNNIMDAAVAQKLLPKLHGSRRKLEKVLFKLGDLCYSGTAGECENLFKKHESIVIDKARYPISFEKIVRMHKGLVENGFTSFAEA